jgi:hypothetical protein
MHISGESWMILLVAWLGCSKQRKYQSLLACLLVHILNSLKISLFNPFQSIGTFVGKAVVRKAQETLLVSSSLGVFS